MRGSRARADDVKEAPFRGPERLALAMPLTAALGLMLVMAAAATGHSALVITLAAIGGFTLCAFAPLALLQLYVGRPLRLALAHLRAARDGAEPPGASPPPGVIADLVAVARDIRAGQQNVDHQRAGLALCEKMAVAGDEAIRAFCLQSEELAEARDQSESHSRAAAQDQFAEIAAALQAFKDAAPPPAVDPGVERIEQMLVYVADALDRREKPADGGERVDAALTDLVRLIGRETQAIRDTVATAALTMRNDIAGALADDKAAHGRQQERVEAMEARVLTRLDDIVAPDTSRVVDVIRTEAETTRAALRDRPEPVAETAGALTSRLDALDRLAGEAMPALRGALADAVARLDAAVEAIHAGRETGTPDFAAASQIMSPGLGEVAERLREQGQAQTGRFDEIEARLKEMAQAGRDGETQALSVLAKCTDKLRNALDRFDVLSAAAATAGTSQEEAIGAALRGLEGEIAGLGEAQGRTFDALRADVAGIAPRIEDACEGFARRAEALDVRSIQAATRDLAAAQARAESFARQIAVGAAALASLTEREGRDFDGLRAAFHGAEAAVAGAATALSQQWASVMQTQTLLWDEKFGAWGAGALATLDETTRRLTQTGAALARAGEEIETLAAQAQDAQARLGETLVPLDALAPTVCALCIVTETLESSAAQVVSGVEGLQALAPAERPEEPPLRDDITGSAQMREPAEAGEPDALSARFGGELTGNVARADGALAVDPFEAATPTGEARASAEEHLRGLADELVEIGGRIDAFAPAPSERLARLSDRLSPGAAPLDAKFSVALAKIVMSLTDSLDLRFVQIEQNLDDLLHSRQRPETRDDFADVDGDISEIARQMTSAAQVLKAGLSEFTGASAALVEDINARHHQDVGEAAVGAW